MFDETRDHPLQIVGLVLILGGATLMLFSMFGVGNVPATGTVRGVSFFLGAAALGKIGFAIRSFDQPRRAIAFLVMASFSLSAALLFGWWIQ